MREQSIFIGALEKDDPAERSAFLDRACGDDPALRLRIERLLRRHGQADSLLDSPAPWLAAAVDQPIAEGPGTVIGPYTLVEPIAEGGMGVVYVAEQTVPVRRRVALKVIRPGMDTKQVIARFEAERQALAMMEHPNIARVLDAGSTVSGRPYFVMELVRGDPITEYCDREQLSVADRLDLFVLVCKAVSHAHQKGIIHRDLKPSNVLVAVHDGVPVPKVIDFGIAKATTQGPADNPFSTGFAQMMGTPLYMSPEQADLTGIDVDTRSDVYSLGVLLYELLTGTTPVDPDALRKAPFDDVRRIIREREPAPPSTRLRSLGARLATVARDRGTDIPGLRKSVAGELDWIVMKSLEKDRGRRYETPGAFGADVVKHRSDLPVEACPSSAWYRLRKVARRNRAIVVISILAVMVFVLMLAAVAGMGVGLVLLSRKEAATHVQRQRAERHLQQVLQGITRLVLRLQDKNLDSVSEIAELRTEEFRHALETYETLIDEHAPDPSRRCDTACLLQHVAILHFAQGHHDEADRSLNSAIRILEDLVPRAPDNVLFAMMLGQAHHILALQHAATGRSPGVDEHCRRAAWAYEQALRLAPAHGPAYNYAAWFYAIAPAPRFRDPSRAVALAHRGLQVQPDSVALQNDLGVALYRTGRWAEAVSVLDRARRLRKDADNAFDGFFLAMALHRLGRTDEARSRFERAANWMNRRRPGDHELILFHAEARDILGLQTPPTCPTGRSRPCDQPPSFATGAIRPHQGDRAAHPRPARLAVSPQ
jgi:serine/threonine protein kinase/tetratricopeptide (TPR) repeat protein